MDDVFVFKLGGDFAQACAALDGVVGLVGEGVCGFQLV